MVNRTLGHVWQIMPVFQYPSKWYFKNRWGEDLLLKYSITRYFGLLNIQKYRITKHWTVKNLGIFEKNIPKYMVAKCVLNMIKISEPHNFQGPNWCEKIKLSGWSPTHYLYHGPRGNCAFFNYCTLDNTYSVDGQPGLPKN